MKFKNLISKFLPIKKNKEVNIKMSLIDNSVINANKNDYNNVESLTTLNSNVISNPIDIHYITHTCLNEPFLPNDLPHITYKDFARMNEKINDLMEFLKYKEVIIDDEEFTDFIESRKLAKKLSENLNENSNLNADLLDGYHLNHNIYPRISHMHNPFISETIV